MRLEVLMSSLRPPRYRCMHRWWSMIHASERYLNSVKRPTAKEKQHKAKVLGSAFRSTAHEWHAGRGRGMHGWSPFSSIE